MSKGETQDGEEKEKEKSNETTTHDRFQFGTKEDAEKKKEKSDRTANLNRANQKRKKKQTLADIHRKCLERQWAEKWLFVDPKTRLDYDGERMKTTKRLVTNNSNKFSRFGYVFVCPRS